MSACVGRADLDDRHGQALCSGGRDLSAVRDQGRNRPCRTGRQGAVGRPEGLMPLRRSPGSKAQSLGSHEQVRTAMNVISQPCRRITAGPIGGGRLQHIQHSETNCNQSSYHPDMELISVKLPPALRAKVAAEARRRNISQSTIVRESLERSLSGSTIRSEATRLDLVGNLARGSRRGWSCLNSYFFAFLSCLNCSRKDKSNRSLAFNFIAARVLSFSITFSIAFPVIIGSPGVTWL
jgi:hypothetical protein